MKLCPGSAKNASSRQKNDPSVPDGENFDWEESSRSRRDIDMTGILPRVQFLHPLPRRNPNQQTHTGSKVRHCPLCAPPQVDPLSGPITAAARHSCCPALDETANCFFCVRFYLMLGGFLLLLHAGKKKCAHISVLFLYLVELCFKLKAYFFIGFPKLFSSLLCRS